MIYYKKEYPINVGHGFGRYPNSGSIYAVTVEGNHGWYHVGVLRVHRGYQKIKPVRDKDEAIKIAERMPIL